MTTVNESDDDNDYDIAKHEVSWTIDDIDQYKVKIELTKHYARSQIMNVFVELFHENKHKRRRKDDSTNNTKKKDDDDDDDCDESIGSLNGTILKRPSNNFFELGDIVSDELQWFTCLFCDVKGRLSRVDTNLKGKALSSGGFFHIDKISVNKEHKGKDIGLRMIYETLSCLKEHWNICVLKWLALNDGIIDRLGRELIDDSNEDNALSTAIEVKIAKHFARMGFQQAGKNKEKCSAWYLTSKTFSATPMSKWKTKKEIEDSLDIFVPPPKKYPEGVDKELQDLIKRAVNTHSHGNFPSEIRDLVTNKGANIETSRAIHIIAACASQMSYFSGGSTSLLTNVLQPLLDLGADVNAKDDDGNTPLHVASAMNSRQFMEVLTRAGADSTILNNAGDTPLQCMQKARQAQVDFMRAFSIGEF